MTRTPVSRHLAAKVLVASRRRCCLCVYLNHRDEVRPGQIAHLNKDASESTFDNLVYLCLEHHDQFDSRSSQSKGFSEIEVRSWRQQLYRKYPLPSDVKDLEASPPDLPDLSATSEYSEILQQARLSFLSRPWRYALWQVANQPELFAYKTLRSDGVCLIERIDLPDGRIVVVCIQVPGNPGKSVTNSVEELCLQVCDRFSIPAEKLVWLEHYDHSPEEWNMVTFGVKPPDNQFSDPRWTAMTPEMWKSLKLRPKKKMKIWVGFYQSKVTKLFHWPTEAILD